MATTSSTGRSSAPARSATSSGSGTPAPGRTVTDLGAGAGENGPTGPGARSKRKLEAATAPHAPRTSTITPLIPFTYDVTLAKPAGCPGAIAALSGATAASSSALGA